jgi:hypothetical protein
MVATGKKCWARSVKKWLLKNQPQEVVGFLPSVQPSFETTLKLATTRALQARTAQPATTHIHLTRLAGVRGWAKSQVL